ncbi:MAG: hypothetical protein ACK6DP_05925 [Gemmatimonas sp.]|jgi:hypothetical protein|uniref:hypothetical protein n=1 Tax=Gemmatimonas sp. TaxID=1962908 RepID=UPI00391F3946|nr:hypothetical protein [Gemmatimonadota bacterium]
MHATRHVPSSHTQIPLIRRSAQVASAWVVMMLTACRPGDDGTVTIRGDVPGLDTLGYRADSLLGAADRSALVLDSMRAAMRAELAKAAQEPLAGPARPSVTASGNGTLAMAGDSAASAAEAEREARRATMAASALSAGNAMSRRALERGDSMARAIARRMTSDERKNRTRGDTLRGVLTFEGDEPAKAVVLRTGGATVALSGMATTGLSRLVGAEVVVRGLAVSPRDIVVADYLVRAVNGTPVFDGTLLDGGMLRLTDGSGVHRVPLPPALDGLQGARVWIAVRDGAVTAYGLVGRR